ncbi:NUDIX hydrolase [bacterium]|nr:NUDIX hydrolase [bacterium]
MKKTPRITADIIIELEDRGIVLIKRKNPPVGWALPGGFLDYGESLEDCAIREAKEETSLDIELKGQFHTYSTLDRDPRWHTVTMVFVATSSGAPKAATDASEIGVFKRGEIPEDLVFDHNKILEDYFKWKDEGKQRLW